MIARLGMLSLLLVMPPVGAAEEPRITLRDHQPAPGERVMTTTKTRAEGGTISVVEDGATKSGTTGFTRRRVLEHRIVPDAAGRKLELTVREDTLNTTLKFDGPEQTEKVNSALLGRQLTGVRNSSGRWSLMLGGGASGRQATELSELEAYVNRRWFIRSAVKVGDTWDIDPGFLRHLIARDFGAATTDATLTLREINTAGAQRTAILDCRVKTKGERKGADAGAGISLAGTLEIDLATMLDRRLVLNGSLVTYNESAGRKKAVKLPLTIEVTKTPR